MTLVLRQAALAAALAVTLPGVDAQTVQTAQTLQTRSLAASCAQCHGTDGQAPPGSAVGGLAGMAPSYLGEQMRAFKTGVRPGTVMPQLAKGFSEEQIDRLAGYFAQVPKVTAP